MYEELGNVIVDGKMYQLKGLTIEELNKLDMLLQKREEQLKHKLNMVIGKGVK